MKPLRIGAGLKPSREREGLKRPVENIEKIPINPNCTHGAGQSNQSRPSEAPPNNPSSGSAPAPSRWPRPAGAPWASSTGGDHSRGSPFVVWGAKLDRLSACRFPRATVSSTLTWPYRAAKEVTRG